MRKTRCPHEDIQYCPLYIASHGTGLGCDDGGWGNGQCAVDRRMSYERERELVRVKAPGLVEQAEWREAAARRREQQGRNLRLNGIH